MTTLADIQSGQVGYRWVLLIEGCEFALCSRDPSTIATYLDDASWDWSDAIDGLTVLGGWEQSLEPWETGVQVGRLSFAVSKGIRSSTDAESDAFAELVFGNGNGFETYLNAALDCNDTTTTVLSTSTFPSSGTVHIGTEAIGYTGKTATTFTGCTRGKYAPFKANTEASQRFGQPHRIAAVGDSVVIKPKVTSKQREWTGRRVGLYMLSDTSTAWSDRRLVWAGKIEAIRDGTNGLTYLECIDIKSQIKECMLLRHQFRGRIQEGVYLQSGMRFDAGDVAAGISLGADTLVVSDSPTGSEIASGIYTLDELADTLNDWFAAEKAAGHLNFKWSWSPAVETVSGVRSVFSWTEASASGTNDLFFTAPRDVIEFMGFLPDSSVATGGRRRVRYNWDDDVIEELASGEEPYRSLVTGDINDLFTITVEDISGELFDNRAFLPNLNISLDTGVEWVVLRVGGDSGPIALFEIVSESSTEVVFKGGVSNDRLDAISGTPWGETQHHKVRYSEGGDMEVRQVGLIGGRTYKTTSRLIASTGTNGYNHATYDAYPQQLGAGVPWELLGTNWIDGFQAFDSGQIYPNILYIDKPTPLMSVVGADLAVRLAQIVWKDEGIRVTSWGTPTAARALHAFTESNKAVSSDAKDPQRVSANQTDDFLVNHVTIKYGRNETASDWTIIDPASQDVYGQRGKEIDLPNVSHVPNVQEISADLETLLPLFSRPLHIITRTVNPTFYEGMAPGDFCTITDLHARDPSTGTRGLSSKAGLITRVSIDWGGFDDSGEVRPPHGEVDILILPLSNIAPYSPCAEVDFGAANGGYDAANQRLTLEAHEHSESGEVADATQFPASSAVRVVEIDPADPASPLTWTTTVAAQSGNTMDLDDALTGWDNTKRYRVVSQTYSAADSTQQTDVYQADDADGMIEDTAGAYVYGTDITQAGTWTDDAGTEQVALYSQYGHGDGAPLDTGYEKDLARLVNNLVNFRTAVICPSLSRSVMSATVTVKRILAVMPLNLQPGALMLGERPVYVRPYYRSNDGTSVTISVSLCSRPPIGTSLEMGDADAPAYQLGGQYETKTWTTTSTTWGYGTEQSFSGKVVDGVTGKAYLVIESNSTKLETRGVAEVWQGAFDEAA